MSIFQKNLFEKLQNKLLNGINKQKTFISQVKALVKGQEIEPQIIWKGLEGPESEQNASFLCAQLFISLINADKKSHLSNVEEKMAATLLALQFYKNKKPKNMDTIQNTRKYDQNKIYGHSKFVIAYFLRDLSKIDFAQFYISRLVFAPKSIDWTQNISKQIMLQIQQAKAYSQRLRQCSDNQQSQLARIKRSSYPVANQIQSRGLTFGYACFIDHIKNNNFVIKRNQYQHMKQILQAYLNGISQENYLIQYLPVILHLIKMSITFYGCPYQDILKDMFIWSNQLRLMPGKLNVIGEQFFNLLLKQIKIPGSAFRSRIRNDFPALDYKQLKEPIKQYYFVTNSQDFVSHNQLISLPKLRKYLILHSLKVSNIQQNIIEQFFTFLNKVSQNQLFTCYQKAMKILQVSNNFDNFQKIHKIQKQSLIELMKLTKQRNIDKLQQNNLEKKSSSKGSIGLKSMKNIFGAKQDFSQKMKIHPLGLFEYPKYKIQYIPLAQFLDYKSIFSFNSIIKRHIDQHQQNKKYTSKFKLPIVFHGKRDQFFRFIRPIGQYYQKTPIKQLVNIKFFYISKPNLASRPSIASYIGYNDILYRRIISNTFKQKVIYPFLQPTFSNRDTFPVQLMNKCLLIYLKQARNTFNLQLFKCQITRKGIENKQIIQNLYFSQAVTFGIFSQAQVIKIGKVQQPKFTKQQKYYNKQLVQIIASKMKKTDHYTISMQVTNLQIFSNEKNKKLESKQITKKWQFLRIDDIQICNLPRQYFLGKKPNPSQPYLQMTILPTSNGKLFRNQMVNSQNFKQKRKLQQILLAFQDLLVIMSKIVKIRVQNLQKQKPLRVMIDGTLFEGIDSFTLSPVYSVDDRLVSLPIQTFLPFL